MPWNCVSVVDYNAELLSCFGSHSLALSLSLVQSFYTVFPSTFFFLESQIVCKEENQQQFYLSVRRQKQPTQALTAVCSHSILLLWIIHSVGTKYRDRLRLFVFVSFRWIAFFFCSTITFLLQESVKCYTRYDGLLIRFKGFAPLCPEVKPAKNRIFAWWCTTTEWKFASEMCVCTIYILSFWHTKSMQKLHGFDFECVLVLWGTVDANAHMSWKKWENTNGTQYVYTTPHHTTHSINRLSNKNIIYLRVCSMHGPLHHLAAFLLISHIQWPICTWIYRKINRGTVWRCRCCRIQLLIVVMLQSLYTALFCLPFSSLHTMCIWCLFHSHFVLNSTQYLNSRIHLYKASSHSTEPVFRFQSKSSVCAHFRCVCLFFYSFVWLKGNIISESVYEKVCESIRVHLRLFSDSQKKTAKTIFGTYHSSLRCF